MNLINIKLSDLFSFYDVKNYDEEFKLSDGILIETPDGWDTINSLIKKKTDMVKLLPEGLEPFVCASKHLIQSAGELQFADSVKSVDIDGVSVSVDTEDLGVEDAFDISINYPHLYKTSNGMTHHNTACALSLAFETLVEDESITKVIIVRSIASSRETGALPGVVEDKIQPFAAPYIPIVKKLFKRDDAWSLLQAKGMVEFIPTSFLRGQTFENCILIFDEFQNTNYVEACTVIERG